MPRRSTGRNTGVDHTPKTKAQDDARKKRAKEAHRAVKAEDRRRGL